MWNIQVVLSEDINNLMISKIFFYDFIVVMELEFALCWPLRTVDLVASCHWTFESLLTNNFWLSGVSKLQKPYRYFFFSMVNSFFPWDLAFSEESWYLGKVRWDALFDSKVPRVALRFPVSNSILTVILFLLLLELQILVISKHWSR